MTTIAEHFIKKGREEGWQRGREEGRRSAVRAIVLEDLEERFGPVPSTVEEKLAGVRSHELLLELRRQLKKCRSLGEFEQLLDKSLQ